MVEALWYKNSLIYCLSVDSFMDGNGDGIGDFAGLSARLDYLHGLGVGAIWLQPFQPSPRRDHGYDVTDYYGVDPRFGTLGDFAEFVHGCEQRGIRVMMDLVLNHTSDEHPWFKAARDRNSPYRDWYVWSEEKPEDADEGMVFPGSQTAVWDYDEEAGAWYFHRFYKFQPDLNMANPAVREEMLRIMGFWLQLGVSGFRLDAVPFVIDTDEHEGKRQDQDMEFRMLREIRSFTQFRLGDSVLLAEANVPPEKSLDYFGEDHDRLHMMFNFPVNATLFLALATGDDRRLREALRATACLPAQAQWAHFLRNHDELDLSKLEEAEREAVFAAFAPDEDMRLYGRGIRRRLAPMLGGDRRRIELANSLLMSLPGTPVLRYGDEIGMGEDLSLPERESVRTPMQWTAGRNAGFTTADAPACPIVSDPDFAPDRVNAEAQRRDPMSLLNWTERMIRLRRELPAIGYGRFEILEAPAGLLVLLYRWKAEALLVVHNFADEPRRLALEGDLAEARLDDLIPDHQDQSVEAGETAEIEPSGYRWFRVGRSEAQAPGPARGGEALQPRKEGAE